MATANKTNKAKEMIPMADLLNPEQFHTEIELDDGLAKYDPDTLLRMDIHSHLVAIHDIDEYKYNPRAIDNEAFDDLKESIRVNGLLSPPSLMLNPETRRYELFNGGNTRLKALKQLYRETGEGRFEIANFTIHPWIDDDAIKIVQHLIENEVRGKLYHVDKAKTIANLEAIFKQQLTDKSIENDKSPILPKSKIKGAVAKDLKAEKDCADSAQSLRAENYGTRSEFLDFLHNKGYTGVAEQSLSTCRFTNRYLIGVIDYHLSQGMGTPRIIQIRSVYNNLKRYIKNKELDDFNEVQLEAMFKQGLGKYNNFKQPYDYYKLVDVLALELLKVYPFDDLFDNDKEAIVKMMMLKKVKKTNVEVGTVVAVQDDKVGAKVNFDAVKDEEEKTELKTGAAIEIKDETPAKEQNNAGVEQDLVVEIRKDIEECNLTDLRQQAFVLAGELIKAAGLSVKVDKINNGCGYLIKTPPTGSNVDLWCLFYVLLDNSLFNDPALVVKQVGLDVEDSLKNLYTAKNVEEYENTFYELIDSSGIVTPLPGVIGGYRRRIDRSTWQKLSQLEFIAYQVTYECKRLGLSTWM